MNTHWKNSLADPEVKVGQRLCLPGEGDLPLRDCFKALKRGGYDGWLTFEWEKRWHSDLP